MWSHTSGVFPLHTSTPGYGGPREHGYLDLGFLENIQEMCGTYPAFCQKYELKVVLIRAATYLVRSLTQMSSRKKKRREEFQNHKLNIVSTSII